MDSKDLESLGNALLLNFDPYPKQLMVLNSPSCEVLYGGSVGSGKSYIIKLSSIIYALSCPGIQIYIIRRNLSSLITGYLGGSQGFPALLSPLIDRGLVKINNQANTVQFKNGGSKKNKFASGSVIKLMHISDAGSMEKFVGLEAAVIYIDEAASLLPEHLQLIATRLRLGGWSPPPNSIYKHCFPKIVYATNPEGVSRQYLKERFVDVLTPYKLQKIDDGESSLPRLFIPALVIDNPRLLENDPGYLDRLKNLPDEAMKQAYLYGSWESNETALFRSSYDAQYNRIPEFDIPASWIIKRNYDHGITAPWAVLYHVECTGEDLIIDGQRVNFPRGTIIIVDEILGCSSDDIKKSMGITDLEIGKYIREFEDTNFPGRVIQAGAGDAAAWNKSNNDSKTSMESIVEGFYGRKMYDPNALFKPFNKPAGSRVEGYARMRTMFKNAHEWKNRKMESEGLLVTENCKYWFMQVPQAPRDPTPNKDHDVPRGYRDELLDITRYIVLSNNPQVRTITASVY